MAGTRKLQSEKLRRLAEDAIKHGRRDEAQHYLAQALARDERDHAALAMMAELRLAEEDVLQAIFCYAHAIDACPTSRPYKERFLDLASGALAANYSDVFANALIACFRTPALDCTQAGRFWVSLLVAEPRFHTAFGLKGRRSFDPSNRAFFEGLSAFQALFTPLFLEGLPRIVAYDPVFEEFVTHIRRHLLADLGTARTFSADELTTLACALSHYAFATEFVLATSEDESARVEALRRRIEEGELASDAASIALLACYRPLHGLADAWELLERFRANVPLGDVVKAQIADPLELDDLARTIQPLGRIGEDVSARVREQYEASPYPRWGTFSKERLLKNWRSWDCSVKTEGPLRGKGARVLVAGSGTGREAAMIATVLPDATITAVDLSRASLAYALRKARALGLDNIVFKQGDILELGKLEEKFDYISSTGVLHHLRDPVAGWKILRGLLKPGGLMRVGLYSEKGRKAVAAARETIRRQRFACDRESMLRFRREAPALLDRATLLELANFRDYYHFSMFRDLLFHVEEHQFDLPAIAKVLDDLGLRFERFYLPAAVSKRYREMFNADRDEANLTNWHAFEERHPETFRGMYVFWCRKSEIGSRKPEARK